MFRCYCFILCIATVDFTLPNFATPSQAPKQKWKLHLKQLEQVYGRHAALHAQMQALILNKSQRLPTLESSFTGFATMFDTHSDLGVEDIYNDPFQNPDRNINLHAAMELKMDGHFL